MRPAPQHAAIVALGMTLATWACGGRAVEPPRAYVQRLGHDTLAVEIVTRSPGRIEGRVLVREPNTRVGSYTITLGRDRMPTALDVRWETPPSANTDPRPLHVVATVEGDSVVIQFQPGATGDSTLTAARGTRTLLDAGASPPLVGLWQEAVDLARTNGDTIWEFTTVTAGMRPSPAENRVTFLGGDSVSMAYHGDPMIAHLGPDGVVESIDGWATTLKIESERVPPTFDFDSLAADFAARDSRGEGLGFTSPRGTIEISGGGAHFTVDYSRPSVRGREIWGVLVPYGIPWRTGANAATHFSTNRDLLIGGARVPIGKYTLWTTFTADTDTLIINTRTKVWGTNYDAAGDLVRVPLTRTELTDPVEVFTIAIQPTARGGVLQFLWGTRLLSVEMRVVR